jgi:hypothetical protein
VATSEEDHGFLPTEPPRRRAESALVRVVASWASSRSGRPPRRSSDGTNVAGWITGLVVSTLSVILAAILWRSSGDHGDSDRPVGKLLHDPPHVRQRRRRLEVDLVVLHVRFEANEKLRRVPRIDVTRAGHDEKLNGLTLDECPLTGLEEIRTRDEIFGDLVRTDGGAHSGVVPRRAAAMRISCQPAGYASRCASFLGRRADAGAGVPVRPTPRRDAPAR